MFCYKSLRNSSMGLHINLGQNISFTRWLYGNSLFFLLFIIPDNGDANVSWYSFQFSICSQSGGAVAVITWSLIMPQHYARARVFYSMIASRIALKGNFSIIYVHSIFTFFTLRLKFLLSIFITTRITLLYPDCTPLI